MASLAPACCRIAIERRVKTIALLPSLTWRSASSTTQRTPCCASPSAVTRPISPAPTTSAGTVVGTAGGGAASNTQ